MINLDNVPTLEILLKEPVQENVYKGSPLGYNNYNFLENCNIPHQLKLKIEKDMVFEDFMLSCLTEEKSVEWLYQWYTTNAEPDRKFIFLEIANDEYKHSLIYLNLLILLFPEKNIEKEYCKYKNEFVNRELWTQVDGDSVDFQIFKHFVNEILIIKLMRFQAQASTNPVVRQCLLKISDEESKHINLGKKIIFNLDNIDKMQRILLLRITQVLKFGMLGTTQSYLQKIMQSYGINFMDHFENIKQSKRSKDYTTSTVSELFNFGKYYNLFNDSDLESFLKNNDLLTNYEKYL